MSCRCSRLACQGWYACAEVDPQLLNVTRFELDPAPCDAILDAEKNSRNQEGYSANMRVATYVKFRPA